MGALGACGAVPAVRLADKGVVRGLVQTRVWESGNQLSQWWIRDLKSRWRRGPAACARVPLRFCFVGLPLLEGAGAARGRGRVGRPLSRVGGCAGGGKRFIL
jgi:hypothetical protein